MSEDPASPGSPPPTHVTLIGGARVGFWNVTWPFARLRISSDELELWVLGPGSLRFPRNTVTSVSAHLSLPFIGRGVRIEHQIRGQEDPVIFWSFQSPASILRTIEKIGFLTKIGPSCVQNAEEKPG